MSDRDVTGTQRNVLALVETMNDVLASVTQFNAQALAAKDRARTLLRGTTYWVVDPSTGQFVPGKFAGFAGVDFDRYEVATQGGATGASFDGHTTRMAIEKVSGMVFLPDLRLADRLRKWGEALLGSGAFEGLGDGATRWKFLALPAAKCRYWKIAPGVNAMFWEENRASGVIAIGWGQAGDPRPYQSREELEACYTKVFNYTKNQALSAVRAVRWFIRDIKPGDIILAAQGKSRVMGRGVVLGPAEFRAERGEFGNCMPVHWFDPEARDIPQQRSWISTILEINSDLYAAIFNSVEMAESQAGTEIKDASPARTLEETLGGRSTGRFRAADGAHPEASRGPSKAIQVDASFQHSASAAVAIGTLPQAHGTLNMPGMTVHAGTVVFAGASTSGATESWTRATSVPSSRPIPNYPNAETRIVSENLAATQVRKRRLQERGADTTDVDREILDLKRRLREGGQLKPGDSLSEERFLLLDVVGRGGFATVWRAHDAKCDEIVALKVLHSNLAGDSVRLDRFRRGARIMSRLQHELIVRVLEDCIEEGGWHYFAMEYLSGGDLRQAVLEGRVDQAQIVPLMMRVCDAVNLAHSQRIVHRDIKPANILLDQHNQPKLTDFDLVGVVDTTGGTRTGALGTIYYTAPEALSRPMDADSRADVYSLGMTTLFGLCGADLPVEVLRGPEPVFDLLFLTDSMKSVIARAVDWNPGRRYSNAGELRNALEEAMKRPEAPSVAGDWSTEEYAVDDPIHPPLFPEIHLGKNPPPGLPKQIEYKRYHNSRFGFSVDVPMFLSPQPGPANKDGRSFIYKRSVEMVASGVHQWEEDDTVQSAFQRAMTSAAESAWTRATPEGFIEGNSFTTKTYTRNAVTCQRTMMDKGVMAGVFFTFPAAQEAYFGPIAQRVLASLQAPNRPDPRQG